MKYCGHNSSGQEHETESVKQHLGLVRSHGRDTHYGRIMTSSSTHPKTLTNKETRGGDYRCNDCGKAFDCNSHLARHFRTDGGEKPFRCDDCGKTFANSNSLTMHQRLHNGDKPYRCDDCGKTFTQGSNLTKHQRVHTGDKPYRCDDCGKTFANSSHLTIHRRVHTGDKPYKCDDCGKTFTDQPLDKTPTCAHWG